MRRITHLDESSAAVEIQMKIFNLPELTESVEDVVLLCLLMNPRHQYDPSLDGCTNTEEALH